MKDSEHAQQQFPRGNHEADYADRAGEPHCQAVLGRMHHPLERARTSVPAFLVLRYAPAHPTVEYKAAYCGIAE